MLFFAIATLALGTFAIGTDEYVVAGLLPNIAGDMHVSVSIAGQLISMFALTYAISSPVLTTLTARMRPKRLLVGTMLIYILANAVVLVVPSASWLFATRFLAALAASLYTPTALAVVTALVPSHQRGRAIAIVIAGLTIALVLGLPLGTSIGNLIGWRSAFGLVSLISLLATGSILFVLPDTNPSGVSHLSERVAVLRKKHVLLALALTFTAIVGGYTVFSYILPILHRLTTFDVTGISVLLLGVGVAGALGNMFGGFAADRLSPNRALAFGLTSFIVILSSLSLLMYLPRSASTQTLVIICVLLWGIVSWFLGAPINSHLVSLEPNAAAVALSLNQTALYLGISGAAVVGGLVISFGVEYLGFAGALISFGALCLLITNRHSRAKAPHLPQAQALPKNSEVRQCQRILKESSSRSSSSRWCYSSGILDTSGGFRRVQPSYRWQD